MDSFIDWEEGECSFDSEEFCSLVKWIEEQSKGRIEMSYLKGEGYGYEAVPEDMLRKSTVFS